MLEKTRPTNICLLFSSIRLCSYFIVIKFLVLTQLIESGQNYHVLTLNSKSYTNLLHFRDSLFNVSSVCV